jgi:hypothetical protein
VNLCCYALQTSIPKGIEKWDFNDALLNQGVEQVRKDLARAVEYSKSTQQEIKKREEITSSIYKDVIRSEISQKKPEKEMAYEK